MNSGVKALRRGRVSKLNTTLAGKETAGASTVREKRSEVTQFPSQLSNGPVSGLTCFSSFRMFLRSEGAVPLALPGSISLSLFCCDVNVNTAPGRVWD